MIQVYIIRSIAFFFFNFNRDNFLDVILFFLIFLDSWHILHKE